MHLGGPGPVATIHHILDGAHEGGFPTRVPPLKLRGWCNAAGQNRAQQRQVARLARLKHHTGAVQGGALSAAMGLLYLLQRPFGGLCMRMQEVFAPE